MRFRALLLASLFSVFAISNPAFAQTISGTILFEGSPTGDGYVNIWDSGGQHVMMAGNDGSGNWITDPLAYGTYYVTARGEEFGMVSQLYDGQSCPQEYCDIISGTALTLSSTLLEITDIEFDLVALSEDWTISGSILDTGGSPLVGAMRLFDPSGNHLSDFWTDHLGNFQTHQLADGTYFAITGFTQEMLDEAWDDIPCQNLRCDIPASNPIVISGADRSGINFVLDPILSGGRISGQVKDSAEIPLPDVLVVFKNIDGFFLFELWTDAGGNYQTELMSDDSYFIHTLIEPVGLGRELYDNIPCLPADACNDPAYVKANGTPVTVDGADKTGIDFELAVPAGGMISGQVTDADIGIPLADVHMDLLNEFGDYLVATDTDPSGNYYFSGLTDGDYKVIAINVPPGYTIEFYGGEHCPEANCDRNALGTIINITGSAQSADKDIALDYDSLGTRLLGTITRSDGGAPVSSHRAYAGVDLYSESGDFLEGTGTNRAGQYQFHFPGAGNYYLVTVNHWEYHHLINEAWADIKCSHDCNPLNMGADLIEVADGETFIADFELDPSFTIAGTIQFEGSPTGEGYVNIWDSGGQHVVTSAGNDGGGNWVTDPLPAGTYYATARGEDFGLVSQLYDGMPCPQEYCDKTSGTPIELSDSNKTGIDFNLVPFSEDWTISGSILGSGGIQVGGVVRLLDPFGNHMGDFGVDEGGNYQSRPLADGTYFAVTVHTHEALDEAWDDIPCNNGLCDITASTPIVIDGAGVSGIDFVLEPILAGGHITGQVTDDSDVPLPDVMIVIKNSNGDYLEETWTGQDGSYQTGLLADDRYFVNTLSEPRGLGRELYDDHLCNPADACDDPEYARTHATPVDISGADETGIDFKLEVPDGGMISGKVTDADVGIVLSEVHMNLLNAFGDYLVNTNTDPSGDYYFSGLADGDYKVIAIDVPPGYTAELFGGDHCPNGDCDRAALGSTINISGSARVEGKDIALDYQGTRLLGTVSRSDTHAPVSSQYAHMGIDLYNESGDHIGFQNTNRAGQFQFELPGAGSFYLVAINDWDFHGLVNEVWDNIQCYHDCDPVGLGATLIPVTEGTTVVADFELDPGFTISGMIQHEGVPAGAGHVNIWDGSGQFVLGAGTDDGGNWMTPPLAAGNYHATTRGEEFGLVSQLYDGLPCPQEFCDVTSGNAIMLSDSDVTGIDFNLVPISADWTISGSILDSGGSPVGGDIRLVDPFNNWIGEFGTDESGNFQTHTLADGTYFAVTLKTHEMLDEAWDDIPCENLLCDIQASTPIVINGADRGGIDFVLAPIVNGGRISGHVTDGSGVPLADIGLEVTNSDGDYLFSLSTDIEGDYRTPLQANDSYFIHTMNEPQGLGRELYDDVLCLPPVRCTRARRWFIRNRGTPVVVDGADVSGIDFMLEVPAGGLISGRVSDADISIPLPDVQMNLLDPSGNSLAYTNTDPTGDYYFSGLADGDYKVIAIGVPHPRYSGELYGGEHCSDWNCDLNTAGAIINISGGDVVSGRDIALDYVGTRLIGTITRSDTGAPVSDQFGLMGVDVYRDTGEFFRFFPTNKAGQYSLHPPDASSYYLVTVNDMVYHGLLDEVWDDIRCTDNCDPTTPGIQLIEVPENTTVVADFILDPEVAFKDSFE